nr:MAG TPA: hypothetical protein [Caudoviricetes sp.]
MVNAGNVLQSPIERTLLTENKKRPLTAGTANGQNRD